MKDLLYSVVSMKRPLENIQVPERSDILVCHVRTAHWLSVRIKRGGLVINTKSLSNQGWFVLPSVMTTEKKFICVRFLPCPVVSSCSATIATIPDFQVSRFENGGSFYCKLLVLLESLCAGHDILNLSELYILKSSSSLPKYEMRIVTIFYGMNHFQWGIMVLGFIYQSKNSIFDFK